MAGSSVRPGVGGGASFQLVCVMLITCTNVTMTGLLAS